MAPNSIFGTLPLILFINLKVRLFYSYYSASPLFLRALLDLSIFCEHLRFYETSSVLRAERPFCPYIKMAFYLNFLISVKIFCLFLMWEPISDIDLLFTNIFFGRFTILSKVMNIKKFALKMNQNIMFTYGFWWRICSVRAYLRKYDFILSWLLLHVVVRFCHFILEYLLPLGHMHFHSKRITKCVFKHCFLGPLCLVAFTTQYA